MTMPDDPRLQRAAGALSVFLDDTVRGRRVRASWEPSFGPMPALYLGHGAPPLLDDPLWIAELDQWAETLPLPTGIVIVSAHWERAPITISSPTAAMPLVYDFSGFDPIYSTLRYETPDATALSQSLAAALSESGEVAVNARRGLDHGAWVPMKVMYPNASVPTIQLSIPTHSPQVLFDLGTRLKVLRDQGVLVIGSGFLAHGLPYLSRDDFLGHTVPTWSRDFDTWAAKALAAGDLEALFNYESSAPGVRFAHPSVEHLVPLFVTLGMATSLAVAPSTIIDGFAFGLSKRSIEVA